MSKTGSFRQLLRKPRHVTHTKTQIRLWRLHSERTERLGCVVNTTLARHAVAAKSFGSASPVAPDEHQVVTRVAQVACFSAAPNDV